MSQHPDPPVNSDDDSARRARLARLCLYLLLAALSLRGFWDAGLYTGGHRMAHGEGVTTLPPREMVFLLWYFVFGALATVFATLALLQTPIPRAVLDVFSRATRRPRVFLVVAGGLLLLLTLGARLQLLQNAPITDDENTYRFIAQTLLDGRVVNPNPPQVPESDYAFLDYRFVLHNSAGWYGKYPIGHPLVLAMGEALGARFLVVPLLSCLALILTWAIGRRWFGDLEAVLGAALLVVSPQFVLTGATDLSQPTCGVCMLLGLWAMLRMEESADRATLWALAGGLAWGFGILVRPLPGVLFLAVVALAFLLSSFSSESFSSGRRTRQWKLLAVAAVPVLLCGLVLLWVNGQQTGEALTTGYHEQHGGLGLLDNRGGRMAVSFGGGLLRQNFWLFGWPLSFLFIPFARLRSGQGQEDGKRHWYAWAFWGLILAEYAYRLLVPKTVVTTTGPIYLAEIVPLLALATAAGLLRLGRWLESAGRPDGRSVPIAVALAGTLAAGLAFLPVQLGEIQQSARAWNWLEHKLAMEQARLQNAGQVPDQPALIFSYFMLHPHNPVSWAYYPPPPTPECLDPSTPCPDPVVFAAGPKSPQQYRAALDFWRRHFPDRTAWGHFAFPDGTSTLRPMRPTPWPELLGASAMTSGAPGAPRTAPGAGVLRPDTPSDTPSNTRGQ